MSGGQRYLNMQQGNVGQQQRITPVVTGSMAANRGLDQQQQHTYIVQTTIPQQQRRISGNNSSMVINQQLQQPPQQYKTYSKASPNIPAPVVGGKWGTPAFVPPKPVTTKGAKAGPSSAGQPKQRRKVLKVNKGLRHFSMKVCEKVKEKGTTTYNEVADELVEDEMRRVEVSGDRSFDQKNIRRRVYDALNVLMAMNIIAKEKKEIHWLGLPTNTPAQCATLDDEIAAKKQAIGAKEKELKDLLLLQVSLKSLVQRNRESEEQGYIPTPNSHIQLPFIVVNTHRDTHIHCTISQDKTEYFFKFDDKFELNDHVTVLQRMGLLRGLDNGTSTDMDIEQLKQLVPVEFQGLIEDYGRGKTTVDMPMHEIIPLEEEDCEEDEEEDETMIEYVDIHSLGQHQQQQQQQHVQQSHHHLQQHEEIEEEYSEDDTIIEEAYDV